MASLAHKIFSASFQLTLSRGLVRTLALITMPILTHLLAPSAYGIAATAGTLISLVGVIALAGMDISYMRSFNSDSDGSFEQTEVFIWRFVIGAGACAAIILMITWPFLSNIFSLPTYLGFILGAGVTFTMANSMAQTRARLHNQYKQLSVAIIAGGVSAAAASLSIAYWWRQDELALLLSMLTGYIITFLFLGPPSISKLRKKSGLTLNERKTIAKIGLAGIITAPAYWLIAASDRWLLLFFENAASVGIYSIGCNVAVMGQMINSAIYSVWTPETVKEFNNSPDTAPLRLGKTAELIIYAFACVCLAVVSAGGDAIRLLAAPSFHGAADVVPFIALSIFFHGLNHLASASLLLKKKFHYAMWCWIFGGVFCLGCNFLLIPLMGRNGAALTQLLSMALIAMTLSWLAQRTYPLRIRYTKLLPILLVLFLCGFAMNVPWSVEPLLSLAYKFPVGIVIVLGVVFLRAPQLPSALRKKFPSTFKGKG